MEDIKKRQLLRHEEKHFLKATGFLIKCLVVTELHY